MAYCGIAVIHGAHAMQPQTAKLPCSRGAPGQAAPRAGALQTLSAAGIASITVAETENAVPLANGNQIADLGTYTRIDGSTGGLGETADLADVDLASNPFFRQFTDHIATTAQAQALPVT